MNFSYSFLIVLFISAYTGSAFAQRNGMAYQIPAEEYAVLGDLYTQTGGRDWMEKSGWMDPAATNWFGVEIEGVVYDESGNILRPGSVVKLRLPRNELAGPLPESLGNLTNLTELAGRTSRFNVSRFNALTLSH